jgi:hypothetical protein
MDQKPKGTPEEITGGAIEEVKEAPTSEVLPEELRPVVDRSEPAAHPVKKKRRAWSYWTS